MRGFEIIERTPPIDTAIRLTAAGFERAADEDFSRGVQSMLDHSSLRLSLMNTDAIVGYGAFTDYEAAGHELLYVNSIMIAPELQAQGLASRVIKAAIAIRQPEFLGFKTQSPRAYQSLSRLMATILPDIQRSPNEPLPDSVEALVGESLGEQRNIRFPVDHGSYGSSSMYGVFPEGTLSDQFRNWCNPSAGDALVCVGRVKPELLDTDV